MSVTNPCRALKALCPPQLQPGPRIAGREQQSPDAPPCFSLGSCDHLQGEAAPPPQPPQSGLNKRCWSRLCSRVPMWGGGDMNLGVPAKPEGLPHAPRVPLVLLATPKSPPSPSSPMGTPPINTAGPKHGWGFKFGEGDTRNLGIPSKVRGTLTFPKTPSQPWGPHCENHTGICVLPEALFVSPSSEVPSAPSSRIPPQRR